MKTPMASRMCDALSEPDVMIDTLARVVQTKSFWIPGCLKGRNPNILGLLF